MNANENNKKPGIDHVYYNIDGCEHSFDMPWGRGHISEKHEDLEQGYRDFQDCPAVKIVLENGAKIQVRIPKQNEIPIEETFKADDPHSVWAGGNRLNGFDYSHCESKEEKVVFAAQANIDEYLRDYRKTTEDFNDWDNVQKVIDED